MLRSRGVRPQEFPAGVPFPVPDAEDTKVILPPPRPILERQTGLYRRRRARVSAFPRWCSWLASWQLAVTTRPWRYRSCAGKLGSSIDGSCPSLSLSFGKRPRGDVGSAAGLGHRAISHRCVARVGTRGAPGSVLRCVPASQAEARGRGGTDTGHGGAPVLRRAWVRAA
jgi:hypothetical protein